MANPTARELIIDAFRTAGIISDRQVPTGNETQIALNFLNYDLIDNLRNRQLWSSHVISYSFTTISGQQVYSVGVPEILPIVQPNVPITQDLIRIENAQVLVGNAWNGLSQLVNTDFYRASTAQVPIIPAQFTFNKTSNPYDELSFTNPTVGGYLVRFSASGVVKNYGLDDFIDLPSGYYSTLKFGLAELLSLYKGFDENQIKMKIKFDDCLNALELVNRPLPPKLKSGGGTGMYSIGIDQVLYSNGGF